MEYHNDRFVDYSLLIYKQKQLVAILPANVDNDTVYSHKGLTYGGIVTTANMLFKNYIILFKQLLSYLEKNKIAKLVIKELPPFYTRYPSDELAYLQFLTKAVFTRVDVTAAIKLQDKLPLSRVRKRGVQRAKASNLQIVQVDDFSAFWNEILIPNRRELHNVTPTHSLSEIVCLAELFPENIMQFNVMHANKIVAGATLFVTQNTVHLQYAAANKTRQELGSLDFLITYLIEKFNEKEYFNFGISNENNGSQLNSGLHYWKESFGARVYTQKCIQFDTKNYSLLNDVCI